MGSCTWGWEKLPCGLPSRMLGVYKTGNGGVFPVANKTLSVLVRVDLEYTNIRLIEYNPSCTNIGLRGFSSP
jgi:hypothetical protein